MVKKLLVLWLIVFAATVWGQDVTVTAEIDTDVIEGVPLKGSITVTHDEKDPVDMRSFELKGKPLEVKFEKNVKLDPNSPLIISIYSFEIGGKKKGLHLFPEVSVKVGDKVYQSIPSTYEVNEPVPVKVSPPAKVVLGLQPFVDGSRTLYPGQRAKVGYRYIFNYSFDLSEEKVPLLDAKGFRKIGAKEFAESKREGLSSLEVSQVIEAVNPGTFSFGPSLIRGRAYQTGPGGQRQYSRSTFQADAPSLTLTVRPFPERGKPTSFNGAVGDFTFQTRLLSSPQVAVGDQLKFEIQITGEGALENVPMPEVCCQPGFSGFFKVGDLPPIENIVGNTKTFIVDLRPLSEEISAIPSLEFSFFKPDTITYETFRSQPIPIKVAPVKEKPLPEPAPTEPTPQVEAPPPTAKPIEIEGNYPLAFSDLQNLKFGTWWVLLTIPLGIGIWFLQKGLKQKVEQIETVEREKLSHELFAEAVRVQPRSIQKMHEAFMLRLKEIGIISDLSLPPEKVPEDDIRAFLLKLQEIRFAGKEGVIGPEVMEEAKELFARLK